MTDLAAEGFTELEIAAKLGIGFTSITNCKKRNPQFKALFKQAKSGPDDLVEAAIFKLATGFIGPDGKYYPPNPTGAIYSGDVDFTVVISGGPS
jgi:hypothetical protein